MLAGHHGDNMIAGSNPELNELELLNDERMYDDEDEYDLREYERKLRQVQASSDAFTERDEDTTLNESTDIETWDSIPFDHCPGGQKGSNSFKET